MAYEARRDDSIDDDRAAERAENNATNQVAVQGAAEVLSNVGGIPGIVGTAVKYGDMATDGLVSDVGGRLTTHANDITPGGGIAQNLTNTAVDSGLADKALDAYRAKNGSGGSAAKDAAEGAKDAAEGAKDATTRAEQAKNKVNGAKNAAEAQKEPTNQVKKGGETDDSLPSSNAEESGESSSDDGKKAAIDTGLRAQIDEKLDKLDEKIDDFTGSVKQGGTILFAIQTIAPIAIVLAIVFVILGIVVFACTALVSTISDYEDAFGISQVTGEDTGGMDGTISDPDQLAFYKRVVEVRDAFKEDDKVVDTLKIIAVYHALDTYDAKVSYRKMTTSKITDIANAMFDDDGVYDEQVFRDNLKNEIIPTYLPFAGKSKKEAIVDETFTFINNYYDLIDYSSSNSAANKWKQTDSKWSNVKIGNSGSTIGEVGCLVTSIAIQISRSGVQTNIPNFNPGTFVEELNKINAFGATGDLSDYSSVTKVVPNFVYQNSVDVKGMNKNAKLSKIKEIVNQSRVYAVAEVKSGNGQGQHWVAIESVKGDVINVLDPGSSSTNMWDTYGWEGTSRIVYYKAN